jgi:hypothetical protein
MCWQRNWHNNRLHQWGQYNALNQIPEKIERQRIKHSKSHKEWGTGKESLKKRRLVTCTGIGEKNVLVTSSSMDHRLACFPHNNIHIPRHDFFAPTFAHVWKLCSKVYAMMILSFNDETYAYNEVWLRFYQNSHGPHSQGIICSSLFRWITSRQLISSRYLCERFNLTTTLLI